MTASPTGSRFRTTSWTLIVKARASPGDLEQLLRAYWAPIYAYLRRSGQDREAAADLTQAFIADVVLDRRLIDRADPERGRFRSFLVAALNRFVVDEHRHEHGRSGRKAMTIACDPDELAALEPSGEDDPARAFDRQWAATVLSLTVDRLREQCQADGLAEHWRLFEGRVLTPALHGGLPTSLDALASATAGRSTEDVSSMVNTVKRKFRGVLREVVAETVEDDAAVDDELQALQSHLAVL